MSSRRKDTAAIVIAGAGPGGLALALALLQRGLPVRVLERAEELREVGAGLQISPNALRVLRRLGVAETLEPFASLPATNLLRDYRTGRVLASVRLKENALRRWGEPYWHLHRADLQRVLLTAVMDLDPHAVALGQAVTGIHPGPDRVVVETSRGTVEGRVLVGADGIWSRVREAVIPHVRTRGPAQIAYRALVMGSLAPAHRAPARTTIWAGQAKHVVIYPLRGGELVNIVAAADATFSDDLTCDQAVSPAELQARFEDFHPEVRSLLKHVRECRRWPLQDHAMLPRWSSGRVALLGDACHAMLPFVAQGAAMALEDAWVLSVLLAEAPRGGEAQAFVRYEQARRERSDRIQDAARRNGQLFHAQGALTRAVRLTAMSVGSRLLPRFAESRFDWIYAHDVTRTSEGRALLPPNTNPIMRGGASSNGHAFERFSMNNAQDQRAKSGASAVEVVDVHKTYQSGAGDAIATGVGALRGVSLSIKRGESVAIIGKSGSGKSTLLNMIGSLDKPTRGTVLLDGVDLSSLSESERTKIRRHRVGFVFQFFNLLPTQSALENVMLPAILAGTGSKKARQLALQRLEQVGLAHRAAHQPHQMSGGEMQRTAIARALVLDPPLLLADEPTGNLDSESGEVVLQLLSELVSSGRTMILVTHDQGVAQRQQRTIRMRDGAVESDLRSGVQTRQAPGLEVAR